MANNCITSSTLCSKNLLALKQLHNAIYSLYSKEDVPLIAKLLESYGYTEHDVALLSNHTDYVSACDEHITQKGNYYYFQLETCSKWLPNMEALQMLIGEKYQSCINMYYLSEEPGCEVYINTDTFGLFYSTRFKCDSCVLADGEPDYDTDYFDSHDELIAYLLKRFPKADVSYFDTIPQLESAIRTAYDGECEDFFISINAFRPSSNLYSYDNYIKEVA